MDAKTVATLLQEIDAKRLEAHKVMSRPKPEPPPEDLTSEPEDGTLEVG